MTDDLTPTRQAIAAKDRSGRLKVTGKLKVAMDAMIWQAAPRPLAAKLAGMADHSLRESMRKPHVMAYLNAGLEVLRTSERPRNIQRLTEIRDAANNMPAVNAIAALELTPEQAMQGGRHGGARSGWAIDLRDEPAGMVITIRSRPTRPGDDAIDVTSLKTGE